MTTRLPNPGSDAGTWGEILNDYLSVAHDAAGQLRPGIITESHLDSEVKYKINTTTGPQGPVGPEGPQGPQGIQGLAGQDGTNGAQGPQGIQGPAGADGQDGTQGPQGLEGPQGIQGPQGLQGDQGPEGTQGPAGADGQDGAQGPQGIQGPAGPGVVAGGTTNQVLVKASGADYDTQWVAPTVPVANIQGLTVSTTEPSNPSIGDLWIDYSE